MLLYHPLTHSRRFIAGQCIHDGLRLHSKLDADGKGCQRIEHVVLADGRDDRRKLLPVPKDGEAGLCRFLPDVLPFDLTVFVFHSVVDGLKLRTVHRCQHIIIPVEDERRAGCHSFGNLHLRF